MSIPRQEALLVLGLLSLAGVVFVAARLLRARRHGVSLRMQVFLALGFITVVLTSTFAFVIVDRFEARTVVFAHRAALDDARVISELTSRSMETLHLTLEQAAVLLRSSGALQGFTSGTEDTRVQLVAPDGDVLFDTAAALDSSGVRHSPEVGVALAGQVDRVARVIGGKLVAAAVPIAAHGQVAGAARVTKSAFSMRDVLADTAPKVALLALILACAAALAGLVIGHSVARPIVRLTRAAERVAHGDRQAPLPSPRGREVRALTAAFESMRSELERRDAVESLAADLSHELKNPVASVRAAAEVLEDAAQHDPEAALRFARRISASAEKMDILIRDLLALARLEARGIAGSSATVDLEQVVGAAIEEVAEQASAGAVDMAVRCDGRPRLRGDARWLERAVENLLVNALAVSAPGSVVSVSVVETEGRAEILVADHGPGIDPAISQTLFERFVTTRHEQGGTGLGLAIVRAVAEAHGGRAEVRATSERGTTMAISLALA